MKMKRLMVTVVAASIVGSGGMVAQDATPRTPLGPPTGMFEATDLAGNPVPAHFYLTGGGALGTLVGLGDDSLQWAPWLTDSPYETDWGGNRIDDPGYNVGFPGLGDPSCSRTMYSAYPWPVNVPDSQSYCWNIVINNVFVTTVGAVAPLTVTTAGGPLVFHDWEVLDPEPGRCRTGNLGVRAIPDLDYLRGMTSPFAEGVEQTLRGWSADLTVRAGLRAVYAPALPDVSPPLVTVDTPRDCWEIPVGATATVSFSCRDLGVGLATCTAPPGYENGAAIDTHWPGDFSFTVTATDIAGNTRTRTIRYSVVGTAPLDTWPPTATPAVPLGNALGWHNSDVTVVWNWHDAESGLEIGCPATSVSSGEGNPVPVSAPCRDVAGNTTIGRVDVRVDKTPPAPIAIGSPTESATYLRNQAVSASYTCSDNAGGSGIASCAGTVPSGSPVDTSSLGTKTFTVTATDRAGNTTTASRSYNVIENYTFGGFAQPIDPVPTVNVGKAGKTYPVKFQLFELGVPVSDLAAVTGFTYKATSCDALGGTMSDALETDVSGTTSLRYDATSRSFIYNWKTPSTAGCYTLWLTLRTNQQFPAYFQLLK